MLTHASSLISPHCLPVRPTAGLHAQLEMENELLPGNSDPVIDLQYELGINKRAEEQTILMEYETVSKLSFLSNEQCTTDITFIGMELFVHALKSTILIVGISNTNLDTI